MFKQFSKMKSNLPFPNYGEMEEFTRLALLPSGEGETTWYPPLLKGARSLGKIFVQSRFVESARDLLQRLTPDAYADYLVKFYKEGLGRFGEEWEYADIVTILLGLTEVIAPRRYLEIGVRRGRSVCAVASLAPRCHLTLLDMWISDYAGIKNPGPEFVKNELSKVGFQGCCDFINGNSHETLPRYFSANTNAVFDLITVDGDHSEWGATQDLCDILPHLAIGGAVVFDDVSHPDHPELRAVWQRIVVEDRRFSSWTYDEVGYGVGFAIRKW